MSIMRPGSQTEQSSAGRRRVVLRADAGSQIGYGHFVRTVALAAYLRHDFDCVIATRNTDLGHPSEWQHSLVAEAGARVLPVYGSGLSEFDARFIASLHPEDLVVLDNYYFTTEYQRDVRSRVKALVCIDDMHDRHFVADLVLTVCPLTRSDFSLEDYTRFYGGVDRAFLREPFLDPVPHRERPALPRRVALAMGGADPMHLTDTVIAALRSILPDVEVDVIVGQSVAVDASAGIRIWRQIDAGRIVDIFDHADLGIFPASTVCVEAFSRRLPVAAGYYVDNQKDFYRHGVSQGWFAPLGWLPDGGEQIEHRLRHALRHGIPTPPSFDFPRRRHELVHIFKELCV